MRRVIINYGEFKDFSLQEASDAFLKELAARYPLNIGEHSASDRAELLITIAVHEELKRREFGGVQVRRRPTKRELACEIVTKGFHQLSKTHHPDRHGDGETQKLLTLSRDFLHTACKEIEEEYEEGTIFINAVAVSAEITDEDIPF